MAGNLLAVVRQVHIRATRLIILLLFTVHQKPFNDLIIPLGIT
jgi:hypothetical protein